MYRKHPAWLWLYRNDRAKLPEVDENLQQLFDDGTELEAYAERFVGDVEDFADALEPGKTYRQVKFVHDNFECTSDLVTVLPDGSLKLLEIKSSTKPKETHVEDLAFQRLVIEGLGHVVSRAAVLHINNTYVRRGEIEPKELFTEADVSSQVEVALDPVGKWRSEALAIASGTDIPDVSPRFCLDNDTKKEWMPVLRKLRAVPEASIYELPHLKLAQIGELEDQGILVIRDIPDDYKLRSDQQRLRAALQSGEVKVSRDGWRAFLDQLKYPLYFLDYETLNLALPAFENTRPYQQVTFQFSVHIQSRPGAEADHCEYLHTDTTPPLEPLAWALRSSIGDEGTVIVWNMSFEKGRNKDLAEAVPELAPFLTGLNDRMVDLMQPFKDGHFDHPSFLGSASIKKVLPVLVPDLSYKELDVQEGQTASRVWRQAVVDGKFDPETREAALRSLIEYCKLDTLAMVRILEAARELTA